MRSLSDFITLIWAGIGLTSLRQWQTEGQGQQRQQDSCREELNRNRKAWEEVVQRKRVYGPRRKDERTEVGGDRYKE